MSNFFHKIFNCFEKRINNNKLISLINEGDYDKIRSFLDSTPKHLYDINAHDSLYNNIYLLACQHDNIDLLKLLEQKDIDINNNNANGHNALLVSVIHGSTNIFTYLIEKMKLNINKLDVYGNNIYILASKNGNIKIMKYLEKNTEIDILHTNNDGYNAFTIHRYLCSCPETVKIYENMRLSVIYLAQNGFPVHFSNSQKYLADVYYQLYYRLTPIYHNIGKHDNIKCNICDNKFYKNQTVLKCNHNHLSHVKCFVTKSCKNSCKHFNGFNHNSYPDYSDTCIQCNDPYVMKQSNIRVIQIT